MRRVTPRQVLMPAKATLSSGIKLFAEGRIDALAIDDHVGAHAFSGLEMCKSGVLVLFDADAFVVGQDCFRPEPLLCRLEENHMKAAAVDARPPETGSQRVCHAAPCI